MEFIPLIIFVSRFHSLRFSIFMSIQFIYICVAYNIAITLRNTCSFFLSFEKSLLDSRQHARGSPACTYYVCSRQVLMVTHHNIRYELLDNSILVSCSSDDQLLVRQDHALSPSQSI